MAEATGAAGAATMRGAAGAAGAGERRTTSERAERGKTEVAGALALAKLTASSAEEGRGESWLPLSVIQKEGEDWEKRPEKGDKSSKKRAAAAKKPGERKRKRSAAGGRLGGRRRQATGIKLRHGQAARNEQQSCSEQQWLTA